MKVVIIMPAWNEAENIDKMIRELVSVEFPKIKADMQLLVVDNYSKDNTAKIVTEASQKYKSVHLIQQGDKSGLGWAYIRGMQYAVNKLGADAVMEMDADFQHPPRFVKDMVAAYLAGADYVIGSRYIKGGSIPKEWEFSRKLVSFLGNLFIRIVFLKPQIHDLTTGFRLTRVKGVLDQIDLEHLMEPSRFAHKVDLLYQSIKNAKKVVEVPLEFASRTNEKSKFNPKEMVSTFKVAIILGIKDKQKIIKFGTVGFAGYLVNALTLLLFTSLKFSSIAAWGLSTELAIINNFVFNNIWTFKDQQIKGLTGILSKFLQFNLTSTGGLIIQVVMGVITDRLIGLQYRQIVLPLTVVFLVLPYNYLMYTLVIWRKKAPSQK